VNFVGHAMVARWESDRAAYAFGAMLPDFEHMCGTRLDGVDDPEVAAGIACHHRVDAVFHSAPTFLSLSKRAREQLGARGLPRGSVLAVSHIGVELLIDGVLADDPAVVDGFVAAMGAGREREARLRWRAPEGPQRFARLLQRVGTPHAPRAYADPEAFADSVMAMLSRRPRLHPGAGGRAALVDWAITARPQIAAATSTLADELRAEL